jgi:hypothetical protein
MMLSLDVCQAIMHTTELKKKKTDGSTIFSPLLTVEETADFF